MPPTPNHSDVLLTECRLVNPDPNGHGYQIVEDAAIACTGSSIAYAGPRQALPAAIAERASTRLQLGGRMVTPSLIDCHTHLVFAGDRAAEFELRLSGASYADIARAGGGILSTVTHTRAADVDTLTESGLQRARALLRDGVSTIEIKSGYGLDLDCERRMLQAARRISADLGIHVSTTFLGLHALPAEYRERRADYLDAVIDVWLPTLHAEGLIDAVDAFCENIAFSADETRRWFTAAARLGIAVKLHADQLSNSNAAALVAEFGGLSADHIEYTDEAGVAAMAAAGTVAVLLPGSFYCLGESQLPPIAALRRHGVAMAVATDLNPGTSPLCSLRLAMNQACTLFRLTPAEAFAGVTCQAARALGLSERKGRVASGYDADLAVWNLRTPAELSYWMGAPGPEHLFAMGRQLY